MRVLRGLFYVLIALWVNFPLRVPLHVLIVRLASTHQLQVLVHAPTVLLVSIPQ